MTARPAGFDRLARPYRFLERFAFGGALERARFAHLDALADCRSVLVLGEGDGRALERMLGVSPRAEFDVIDASAEMIALAKSRVPASDRGRVHFIHADAQTTPPPRKRYDAIVTLFVLDCFEQDDAARLVRDLAALLGPGGQWLWADFQLPTSGWRRVHAHLWLRPLYAFFRWRTGIEASQLPDAVSAFEAAGLVETRRLDARGGLLTSRVFGRARSER